MPLTTPSIAAMVCTTLALARGFDIMTFVVLTDCLSVQVLQRELYVRAPRDGLPAVSGLPRIKPYKLLTLLKGAYGLTEAPRLWYLKARSLLESVGAVELKIARAAFVFREKSKEGTDGLIAILSLYGDDGLLLGDPRDPRFQQIKKKVASVFNIKHWMYLGPRPEKHLGMQWQTIEEGNAVS